MVDIQHWQTFLKFFFCSSERLISSSLTIASGMRKSELPSRSSISSTWKQRSGISIYEKKNKNKKSLKSWNQLSTQIGNRILEVVKQSSQTAKRSA